MGWGYRVRVRVGVRNGWVGLAAAHRRPLARALQALEQVARGLLRDHVVVALQGAVGEVGVM